jgi:ParB-like chromosome segregation protein Spo0J
VHACYREPDGSHHSELPVELVPFDDITPPARSDGTAAFVGARIVSVLRAILVRDTLPAVLWQPAAPGAPQHIEIVDGLHRCYASAALGCPRLPVAVRRRYEV